MTSAALKFVANEPGIAMLVAGALTGLVLTLAYVWSLT